MHCGVRADQNRFGIVDGSMCVCLEDHETVDHIIWKCSHFSSQRACLIQMLLLSGVYEETPIQDLCAQLNWKALRECFMFFVEWTICDRESLVMFSNWLNQWLKPFKVRRNILLGFSESPSKKRQLSASVSRCF
jgi:hypothetical protein